MSAEDVNQTSTASQPRNGSSRRREKYTARACMECQQRKVKCSGEDTCRQCSMRKVTCVYSNAKGDGGPVPARKKRKSIHLQDQMSKTVENTTQIDSSPQAQLNNLELQERVRKLEETLKLVTEQTSAFEPEWARSPSAPRERSLSLPSPSSTVPDDDHSLKFNMVPACDGETDTFEALVLSTENLSLSSQLASIRKTLGLGAMAAEPRRGSNSNAGTFHWKLPPPPRLRQLMDIYFRDFECFLPYLDQKDAERRIFSLLETFNYRANNTDFYINSLNFPLAALLCNVLAMAECMEPRETSFDEVRPGWQMYLQGCSLIQRCSSLEEIDLDLIRYYAIASGYLMHSECLRASTNAISIAIQLATRAKLNDQKAWPDCSHDEIMSRKRLWWTIYFTDRRIGQKNGTAYLIRDSEVDVADFSSECMNSTESPPSQDHSNSYMPRGHSPGSVNTTDYLQALVDFAKLWGQIWDRFFAVNAPDRGDWEAIYNMDARIVELQNNLPVQLTWNPATLTPFDKQNEPQMRRRLLTLTRINTLRLIIRQNPLVRNKEYLDTKRFCAQLASSTIEAIAKFYQTFPSPRSAGYFISASLVECICQLVPLLQTSCLQEERTAAFDSFRTAYRLLAELAQSIGSASRAIRALDRVFSVGEVVSLFKTLVAETQAISSPSIGYTASLSVGKDDGISGSAVPTAYGTTKSIPQQSYPTFSSAISNESMGLQIATTSHESSVSTNPPSVNTFSEQSHDMFDSSMSGINQFDDSGLHEIGSPSLDWDQFMYRELLQTDP